MVECGEGQAEKKAEDMVCNKCAVSADFKKECDHEWQFIERKCRYCCSIAKFRCWGTTSFCGPCHKIADRREVPPIKPCEGPGKCALGPDRENHAPNGEEQTFECKMCLVLQQSAN